jgi:Tol biopolymer transport system component
VLAAAVAAASFACHPARGLGSITLARRAALRVIDLATCRERVSHRHPRPLAPPGLRSPDGTSVARVFVRQPTTNTAVDSIVVGSRVVYRVRERRTADGWLPGPLGLAGWSADSRWLFFFVDPYGSNSYAADGLRLQVVSAHGGRARALTRGLLYDDYRTWCGTTLVLTAGGNRIATTSKRLVAAHAPAWRPRLLAGARGRAWGSLACAPDGRSVVVQSQPESSDANFFHTHWSLWRVGLDGSLRRLTFPPRGFADESPKISRDGRTILFVRSRRGVGRLYALRRGRLVGPLLSLGYEVGYYGHHEWWQSAAWSDSR